MAGTHPLARKRISSSRPSATRTLNFRMSPQAGFSICTEASGSATSPALRGILEMIEKLGGVHRRNCNLGDPSGRPGKALLWVVFL